jgi:hypothetical protein
MSKKFFIIIISVVLVLFLVSLIGYYLILQNNGDTSSGGGGVFRNFFPFGGSSVTETPITEEPPAEQPPQQSENDYTKKLRKVSAEQVAGAGLLDFKAGTVVRHIEKATGHIFETELFSTNQNRISNTTIPLVYDAVWGNKNNSLVARYLKDDSQTIDTYGLLLKNVSSSTESVVTAIKFGENLSQISVFGNSVFSLEQKLDASVGYISNFDGTKKVQLWNSPIKELLSQYVNAKTIALTTKPEENTPGFMFFVDTGNGQVTKILGNILGLSTLVNDLATEVLFLDQSSSLQMSVYNIKNKTYSLATPTSFPEKCVWSKKDRNFIYCAVPEEFINQNSLTSWYKGFISFSDNIWKYDIKNKTSSVVGSLFNESGEEIDVIKPMLSENEQYFVFINKKDNSLWSLDLTK